MAIFMLMAFLFAEGGRKVIWKFKAEECNVMLMLSFSPFHSVTQVFLFETLCFLYV